MSSPAVAVLIPDSRSSVSIATSSKTADETVPDQSPHVKRRRITPTLVADISFRLHRRKMLHHRLCVVANLMCTFGLTGLFFMIVENEIRFEHPCAAETYLSWMISLIISVTTAMLVICVFYYHHLDLNLYAVNNSLRHWRIGLTTNRMFLIAVEAFICAIHPIAGYHGSVLECNCHQSSTTSNAASKAYTTMNVKLGLLMFARVYLVCRVIAFQSDLVRHVSWQSLGILSQVSFDFRFLVKTYLTQWPTRCLLIFCSILFLIGSWSLRACECNPASGHLSVADSMWLFIVTLTTVGYGDLTPLTSCGRSVATMIALVGILSTALLISVLAQKLQFTRSEKYVHNFMLRIGLLKKQRDQAANVIKFAIKLYVLRRKDPTNWSQYIRIKRRLLRSAHFIKRLKQEQRELGDACVDLSELLALQRGFSIKAEDNGDQLEVMELKVDKIEDKLAKVNQSITDVKKTLDLLLQRLP